METVNATQFLRNDHKVVKGLFTQVEALGPRVQDRKMTEGVLRELYMMLEVHSRIEEELFYPALRENPETAILIEQSFESHRDVKEMISSLRVRDPREENYRDSFMELMSDVTTHVATEESDLFPLAERILGAKLMDLGHQMAELKLKLIHSPEYRDARPEIVQDPNGGEQIRRKSVA